MLPEFFLSFRRDVFSVTVIIKGNETGNSNNPIMDRPNFLFGTKCGLFEKN